MNLAIITNSNDRLILVIDLDKITLEQAMYYYNNSLIVHIRNN